MHALFNCSFSKEVWAKLPPGYKWSHIPTLSFKDLMLSILSNFSKEEIAIFATCTWLIWHARNRLQHEREYSKKSSISLQEINLSKEFLKLTSSVNVTHAFIFPAHSFQKWIPHNPGFLKANTDISFTLVKIGIGTLVRNHLGVPLLAKAIPRVGHFDVDYRELLGIIEGYSAED